MYEHPNSLKSMQLKKHEVMELFNSSLDNAHYLLSSAQDTLSHTKNKKFPSLGLAELALEELGKSYSCLSYYSQCDRLKDWSIFWKEWKNHDLKAHRAFFYEFFCLLRIEIDFKDKELKFPSVRQSFSKEKEAAFYVDIDKGNRKIHKPEIEISDEECYCRVMSIFGLISAAFYVKEWLQEATSENFKNAISDFAYLTISTNIYQQDVLETLERMQTENREYNEGLNKIRELFSKNLAKEE